jgi:hypothetical protein
MSTFAGSVPAAAASAGMLRAIAAISALKFVMVLAPSLVFASDKHQMIDAGSTLNQTYAKLRDFCAK